MVEKPKTSYLNSAIKIIIAIANNIVANTTGVSIDVSSQSQSYGYGHLNKNRSSMVHIFPDQSVLIDMVISVSFGISIPDIVAHIEQKIKDEVERETRFKVQKINMHVLNVIFN
ncbi:MAG: Asp23/Gls24 family envelope stress response protein [Christensenellaceae bacterium]|nr:Asp23/Gls24 family envelope stress response protein [Christensenellaceae bacterium]